MNCSLIVKFLTIWCYNKEIVIKNINSNFVGGNTMSGWDIFGIVAGVLIITCGIGVVGYAFKRKGSFSNNGKLSLSFFIKMTYKTPSILRLLN